MSTQFGRDVFVPNGPSRKDTAIVLVGTADEYGIDQRSIKSVSGGFYITNELAELVYDEGESYATAEPVIDEATPEPEAYQPSDHNIQQVKDFVTENPDTAHAVLLSEEAGQNRSTLVEWLNGFIKTSGDRAAKKDSEEE